jgi:hypothetical protein
MQAVARNACCASHFSPKGSPIDHGELTDKGVISQSSILRRHAALVEKLYANNPADHVICLDPAPGIGLPAVVDSAGERSGPEQLDFRGLDSFRL